MGLDPIVGSAAFPVEITGKLTSSTEVIVDGGVLIGGTIEAPSISVINGGTVRSPGSTATEIYKLELLVTGQVSVDSTSKIDVSGSGYQAGRTTGNTTVGAASSGSGSYGGSAAFSTNRIYGDYTNPNDWGSGGGGNAGGGLLHITAETLVVDGQLLANGNPSSQGAGSGGGVLISVSRIEGTGSIEAKGGNRTGFCCDGGSGGRIAVYTPDFSQFDVSNIHAFGGAFKAGAGTVYLRDTDEAQGTLIINNDVGGGVTPLGLPGEDTLTISDRVVIQGSAVVANEHSDMTLEFQNDVTVEDSGRMQLDGGLTVRTSFVLADNANLSSAGPLVLTNTGSLAGDGRINASVTSSGVIRPGRFVGTLTIDGDYTQTSDGELVIDINGVNASSDFDRLVVTGTATIDGTLTVALDNSFSPNVGDSFQVVEYASRTGQFDSINGATLADGKVLNAIYNANDLTLVTASPLRASTQSAVSLSPDDRVSTQDVHGLVSVAIAYLGAAAVNPDVARSLQDVHVIVTDLSAVGTILGLASIDTIWIDDDAAGLGWFVDRTPSENTEFEDLGGGLLRARRGSAADERVDLLTVLLHELGHVLGLEHSDLIADDLMDDLLGVGQRRLPTAEDVDAIFNSAR